MTAVAGPRIVCLTVDAEPDWPSTYEAGEAWRKVFLPFSGCSRRRISLI